MTGKLNDLIDVIIEEKTTLFVCAIGNLLSPDTLPQI
jgi:hypothetical protein